jgi:NAD(P) transhydrogenase subunit alpha
MVRIAIPKEIHPGERRVAATPQTILRLKKLGFDVLIEAGAGEGINCPDAEYAEAGATVVDDTRRLWADSELVMKVRPPEENHHLGAHEADLMPESGWLVGFVWPAQNRDLLTRLANRKATVFAMDCIPRITRAQKMDTLSAMANIAGYRAVIEAANNFPRFFGGQITAAGRIDPAKVLVIGAGVAGLSAIGAAKSLGAIVKAFDPRSATKDQVHSMGAEFLEVNIAEEGEGKGGYAKEMSDAFLQAEMALFAQQAMQVDIIITTALIPGKPAPKLITQGMVESMKRGSVIVDLAAEQGGNCALTHPGKVVHHKGVTIIGYTDLPSRMANMSSQLYGSTIVALLEELKNEQGLHVDLEDQVVRGAIVLDEGKLMYPPPMPPAPPEPGVPTLSVAATVDNAAQKPTEASEQGVNPLLLALAGLILIGVGWIAPASTLSHFTVFMLACFVGWQVVWNVKPALHTPLMSVTNAISGIILVGGVLELGSTNHVIQAVAFVATAVATINIFGGFAVTGRMLQMFRKD